MISNVAEALAEVEREKHRVHLLMEIWRHLDDFAGEPGSREPPARLIRGEGGPVRARLEVVRQIQSEAIVAAGVARRRLQRILAVGTNDTIPERDDDNEPETFTSAAALNE